jgi:SAM-dependent MidA family methyltransferase
MKTIFLTIATLFLFNFNAHACEGGHEVKKRAEIAGIKIHTNQDFQCQVIATLPERMKAYLQIDSSDSKIYHADAKSEHEKDTVMTEFLNRFPSHQSYMRSCLQDPDFGYYATKARIIENALGSPGEFTTMPHSMSPNFGRMIAYQAYAMWLSMIHSGDITENETFYLIEYGAGEGVLAYDALRWLKENAQKETTIASKDTLWSKFWDNLQYIIIEKSDDNLMKRQMMRNKSFIDANKLKVMHGDVTNIDDMLKIKSTLTGKVKGVVVSNEVPDTFPVHKVKQTKDGKVKVCVCVPLLKRAILPEVMAVLKELNKDSIEKDHADNLKLLTSVLTNKETKELHDRTACNNPLKNIQDYYILHGQQWLTIKKALHLLDRKKSNQKIKDLIKKFDAATYFLEIYVAHENFPEIQAYLQRHKKNLPFSAKAALKDEVDKIMIKINNLPEQTAAWFINNKTEDLLKGVSAFMDRGFHLLIDYGNDCSLPLSHVSFPSIALRFFPDPPQGPADYILLRANYGYAGHIDITSDVNFADLILFGSELGLKTRFYGHQKSLADVRINISKTDSLEPFDLANPIFASRALVQKFRAANYRFKMIIQSKVSDNNTFALSTPSNDPFPDLEKRIAKPKLSDLLIACQCDPMRNLAQSKALIIRAIDEIDNLDQEDLLLIEACYAEQFFSGSVNIVTPVIEKLKKKGLLKASCANACCLKTNNLKNCSRCKQVHYCSRECQAAHWKSGHKENCAKVS